ncbi:MAG: silent information regulator protein Sir2 [Ruminococcus sp.]|nr:silent information regulator protein Sir2 [Ruminococcus sp.]
MRNSLMKKRIISAAAAAVMSVSCVSGTIGGTMFNAMDSGIKTVYAAESTVKFNQAVGYAEAMYATWASVSGASGYNVYVDGVQIDSMLIRQYPGYMRADAVGLKAGSHTMKVVPIVSGKEDASKAAEITATSYANDRSGYAFEGNHSPGAYKADGTLKDNAIVVYVTNENKDSITVKLNAEGKGEVDCTGIQNIITAYKKGKETRPIAIRCIGNITDPSVLTKGDLVIDTATAGMTIEGIGSDATFNGFGLVLKNAVDVEVRNIGFMNCDSSEGDNCGLQQNNSYCWVHNCDFFYGDAGSDADQAKGDGALDTKKSHHITHSYNHFVDNGKCNLQGANSSDTSNYITYHHNWFDHSDSRHPRVRVATVHVYNNYYDGNAKYGIGSTTDSDIFAENNYFRNCKNPMMISGQGTDAAGEGTFSGEVGGMIKAYGNIIEGGVFVPYSENNTQFDAYDAKSRDEKVPSSVKAADGGATYNNFDTESSFYSYKVDAAADVPAVVMSKAGRVDGGDFKWQFNNSVDDSDYSVNSALKSALKLYDDSITAIGSGFKEDNSPTPVVTTTIQTPVVTTTTTVKIPSAATTTSPVQNTPVTGSNVIYASPNGGGDGSSMSSPTDVKTAIKSVKAGGTIYLLDGTYKYTETILIEESNSGSSGALKTISAYPGAKVVFDFTGMAVSGSNRGFVLDGSYWHFYGFEIYNAGDNGMLLSGDNNIIEMMIFNDNEDTGLQLSRYQTSYSSVSQWPSYNLILNCTSKNNCDEATMENADGFAAKLTCGEGNVFDGCMAYNNSDDGWDLYAKTETGPIGVVTIQNCVAFRNGYTEDGRGYGDCDGNGFKLGGAGVGSPHVVKNCLAFENLNCGFTDNNNPELASISDSTAVNNSVGGNGKPNFSVYRCTNCNFDNLMSYYNNSSIKIANDKYVGTYANGVYYNSGYYKVDADTKVSNGSKIGTKIDGPSDSDFIATSVSPMGTDFHKVWRNADGSLNTGGYFETKGTYESMGYHFDGSGTVVVPPVITTTQGENQTTTTTTTTTTPPVVNPPVEGGYVHDFTENGNLSSFYTITGNLSTSKGSVNYAGKTLTRCLKIESATNIAFNAPSAGKLTLVFAESAATIKIDGTKYTSCGDGIITADLSSGSHTITKADSANLFYMVYAGDSSQGTTTTTSTTTTTTTTTTIPNPQVTGKAGDANGDGQVNMADAVLIMQSISNPDKYRIDDKNRENADVYQKGSGVTSQDALAIQKYVLKLIDTLPES